MIDVKDTRRICKRADDRHDKPKSADRYRVSYLVGQRRLWEHVENTATNRHCRSSHVNTFQVCFLKMLFNSMYLSLPQFDFLIMLVLTVGFNIRLAE